MALQQIVDDEELIRYQLKLSQHHRSWCSNLPATDLDLILIEYNKCQPVAVLDFKSRPTWRVDHNITNVWKLAHGYGVPAYIVEHTDDWRWTVFEVIPNTFRDLRQWKDYWPRDMGVVKVHDDIDDDAMCRFVHELRGATCCD